MTLLTMSRNMHIMEGELTFAVALRVSKLKTSTAFVMTCLLVVDKPTSCDGQDFQGVSSPREQTSHNAATSLPCAQWSVHVFLPRSAVFGQKDLSHPCASSIEHGDI